MSSVNKAEIIWSAGWSIGITAVVVAVAFAVGASDQLLP